MKGLIRKIINWAFVVKDEVSVEAKEETKDVSKVGYLMKDVRDIQEEINTLMKHFGLYFSKDSRLMVKKYPETNANTMQGQDVRVA